MNLHEYINFHKNDSEIVIPAGTYKITDALYFGEDFSGKTIISKGAAIEWAGTSDTAVIIENCKNLTLSNFNLSGGGIKIMKSENTLIAENTFNDAEITLYCSDTFNTVIIKNVFDRYKTAAVYDDGTRNLAVIENNFNGIPEYPVSLGNTQIAAVNNNTYTRGKENAVINRGGAVQIFGDEIPGVGLPDGTVGVDMSRLPQIDRERFVNMPRSKFINHKSVYEYILSAYNSGSGSVIIPPGAYFVSGENFKPHMPFRNIKDFTIYAYGALFEFEHFNGTAFSYTDCDNMALKGLTMDYSQVPNPQGTITGISEDGNLIWTANTGYIQDLFDDTLVQYTHAEAYREGSDIPYADTWWDKNSEIIYIKSGVYKLTAKTGLTVGSKVIFRGRFAHVNHFKGCVNMSYEDVTVFAGSGFGFMELNGGGNSKLNRVAFTPGPKPNGATEERLISTCDATHAVNMREGMKVTNCLFEKMTDDATNNCGSYGLITEVTGNILTYANNKQGSSPADFKIGDRALVYNLDGRLLCDANVIATDGRTLTLDKSFEGFIANATIIENASSNGNNFMYDNCLVQNNRSRGFLIKSPYGTITNCTLKDNGMSAILISPEIADNWGECGFSWDITITNNRFIDGGFFTGSDLHSPINITGDSFLKDDPAYYNHGNILIQNNSFEGRYTKYCINANSVNGLKILGNTFALTNSSIEDTQSSFSLKNPEAAEMLRAANNTQPPVNVQGAQDIEVSDNIYIAGK